MATWRCLSCLSLYVSPQRGVLYFHACGEQVDHDTGDRHPYPNPRDENIVQDRPGGPVRMRAAGAGREKIDEGDALSGATHDHLKKIHGRPAIGPSPFPETVYPVPDKPVMPGGNQ